MATAEEKPASEKLPSTSTRSLMSMLVGDCLCDAVSFAQQGDTSLQFVELHGIRYIGLGALTDELTPKERVYDTLEQLTIRSSRLITIGYLLESETTGEKIIERVPLDVWNKTYHNEKNMATNAKNLITAIKAKDYTSALKLLGSTLKLQKANLHRDNNRYLAGITAHNLAVVYILAGNDHEAIPVFEEAIQLKEASFGKDHSEVAISYDELGVQYFAHGSFETALDAFRQAQRIRQDKSEAELPMVLNNIGCCNFQLKNHRSALLVLQEAREIKLKASGSSAQADLDLLHIAIIMCNCGYLNLCLKQYDQARSLFEEALLIQQSVLDNNHRAIKDTLSNLHFANAFQIEGLP